jgi:predicted nucleic acid-binding protein
VLNGKISAGTTDVVAIRQDFGGVQSLELNDQIALEATRIQDQLMDDGERMAARDLLIAATARSTGAELIVADSDFETRLLTDLMDVTNLRTHD